MTAHISNAHTNHERKRTMMKRNIKAEDSVTLTRADADTIIRKTMGWDPIDVQSFWKLARDLQTGGRP